MNKLKDILYDKNDILIALIILIIAGLLINNRINVIMDYPSTLVAEAGMEVPDKNTINPPENNNDVIDEDTDKETPADQAEAPDKHNGDDEANEESEVSQVTINIEYGSTGSQIAQLLIDSGLISSKQEFFDAVTAAAADTKLQAGNFIIPSDASPAEIIAIITN
jgi:hypothetical protein